MTVSMAAEALFLFRSFLFGLFAALLYDGVRLLRICLGVRYGTASFSAPALPIVGKRPAERLAKPPRQTACFVSVFLTDLLYFLLLSILYILFLYGAHQAVFRLYSPMALIGGFALYRLLGNRLFLFLAPRLLFLLLALQEYALFLFFKPIFQILKIIFCVFRYIFDKILLYFSTLCGILMMRINCSLTSRRRCAVMTRWQNKEK